MRCTRHIIASGTFLVNAMAMGTTCFGAEPHTAFVEAFRAFEIRLAKRRQRSIGDFALGFGRAKDRPTPPARFKALDYAPIAYDKFEAWVAKDSPWQRHLAGQFVDGLARESQRRHRELIAARRCAAAVKYERVGFGKLYPELAAIFKFASIRRNFEQVIVPQFSHSDRYCRAMRFLDPLIIAAQRETRTVLDYSDRAPRRRRGDMRPPVVKFAPLYGSWFMLERLALCDQFAPALRTYVRHSTVLAFAKLHAEGSVYAFRLAQKMKLGVADLNADFNELARRTGGYAVEHIETTFDRLPVEESIKALAYRERACEIPVNAWPLRLLYP